MNNVTQLTLGAALIAGLPLSASAADSMKSSSMPSTLSVAATFDPAPPKKGMETITVVVKDPTGKPVKGATVRIASNMPSMSMSGPKYVAREASNGTYATKANLNFATMWTFDINASANGRSGKARLSADVK